MFRIAGELFWKVGYLTIVLLWCVTGPLRLANAADDGWSGPVPPITEGYGSWGSHEVSTPARFSMKSNGHFNSVTLYFPVVQTGPAPTIFFAPGWDIPCESYGELLRFLASKGYVAVCDDYVEDIDVIGGQLVDTFIEAARRYPSRIDTSRFGLVGHSAGGGLLPSVGYRLAVHHGWGARGMFLFSSAPWFDFDITDGMLATYPANMKVIVETYEEDTGTDLRTFIDQFESLTRIPDTEKDYIILRPTKINGYRYHADHPTIATGGQGYGVYDAMDSYGVFRLVDALADATFTGNEVARKIALGDGGDEQTGMAPLKDLVSTENPRPIPGLPSDYPCDVDINPRRQHCADYDRELPAPVLLSPAHHTTVPSPSPEFVWEPVPTATWYTLELHPLTTDGQIDWNIDTESDISATMAGCPGDQRICRYVLGSDLSPGLYTWRVKGTAGRVHGVWSRPAVFKEARRPIVRHPTGRPQP